MKAYISGPITGTTDYMKRFKEAEEELRNEGYSAVNPAKVNAELPEDTTYQEYMAMAFKMLDMCDFIYMTKGWQQSRGCNAELAHAIEMGITIVFQGGSHAKI